MNIARNQRLAYNELPHFDIGEPYQWVSSDECPTEVQLWILGWLMAKRTNTTVPPFPTRYEGRFFGQFGINAANGWHALGDLADCAPPADGIVFGSMELADIGKQNSDGR